jgi:hypothetical protein
VTAGVRPREGKDALPRRRRHQYRETPDVAAATRRLIRTLGKRIGTEDPGDLRSLIVLDEELRAWRVAVAGMRQSGFTDREIGAALGTTRQAVEQRWPRNGHRPQGVGDEAPS